MSAAVASVARTVEQCHEDCIAAKTRDGRTLRVAASITNPVLLKAVHQTHSKRSGSSTEVEPSELLHDLE